MHPISCLRRHVAVVAGVLGTAMLLAGTAFAAGPRWTTGWPYYQNNNGTPITWYTTQPQYFTDPGDLSAYVNHAAADAMVAAAAATWTISLSSLTLAQGGALNEHVSSANVYLGSSGPVFPSDVQASNYAAKQIAVIYDSDGSVTDTLLGGGASDPSNCRQGAVTESVDSISTSGQILHALLILNGRCTGSAAALQMEMQYRLTRAFGRILGLGWSQLNDNVFTGLPQPTSQQAMNWPILHPIDVLCGPYAYQCMVQPFTLRTDDMASLISLYPVTTAGNGKTASFANAANALGFVSFPNGQGMEGVLVSIRRFHFGPGYTDAFDVTSGVTGAMFEQTAGNLTAPKDYSQAESNGSTNLYYEGYYTLGWIPILTADYFDNFTVTTSAINPLYTGQYAVGPYAPSQVTPSGDTLTATATVVGRGSSAYLNMTSTSAPATCSSAGDGSVNAPLAVASSGSWSDTLCGYQHSAWSALPVKAGRSLTLEVTATDEQGYATTGKMLPVLGVWDSNDPSGGLPTLASQPAPLNASTLGMTNLMVSTSTARTMRIGIADQRGDGRPDYGYNARILYADSISPASLPANGGVATIAGMGFHPGNPVTVNGIAANVTNWTATSITLVAPAITGPLAADVVVTDLSTGGQTTMSGALTYSQTSLPDVLSVVSKPADGGYVGSPGSPVFQVQVLLPDGVTPAAGVAATFSSATAALGACSGASTCTLTTDSSGLVSSSVTPTSAGTVTLTAAVGSSSVSASFAVLAIPVDGLSIVSSPSGTVYATLPATVPFSVKVTLPGSTTAAAGANVVVTAANAALSACSGASTCTLLADASGVVSTTVTPAAAGVVSLLATAGGGMVSASFGATALPADVLRVVSKPADGSYGGRTASVPFAVQAMLGDNATPASGVAVTLTAAGATLAACGASTCVLTADTTGSVSTSVVPSAAGTVTLTASAGGGAVSTSFHASVVPPDVLHAVSRPADGSYVGRTAAIPFNVQVSLGDTGAAAAGVSVSVSTTNGILNACGAATCTLLADATGTISTTVTPSIAGTVNLTASAGGGTLSVSFLAVVIPPDTLTVLTKPANGSYVGRAATLPFAVQIFSGETGAPASAIAVTVTATGATLAACSGTSSCTLTADSTGTISTSVTPSTAGSVGLTATAGGGTISTTFNAVAIPPDALHILAQPASGSYVGRAAAISFAVQTALGDTGAAAAGVSVSLSATNAVLNACGAATCTLTADSTGTVSTTVTPSTVGSVSLSASAGGGTASTSFNAIAVPPDALHVVTAPADGSFISTPASAPFTVQVALGDTGAPAAGASVLVSATNAILNACGASTCTLTADSTGTISTTVTPSAAGTVSLSASAGGGSTLASFLAAAIPPDTLIILTRPLDGAYIGRVATTPFTVQIFDGETGAPAAGVSVTVAAAGATLTVCIGATSCVLTADSTGTISTTLTPSAIGLVSLSASANGGVAGVFFNAVAVPPDTLTIVTQPANGSYAGRASAIPFAVQVAFGDTGSLAGSVSVSVSATNAVLTACAASACTLTVDATGTVTTTVTPSVPGPVALTASAGGGTVLTSFNAVAIPPDSLQVVTAPASNSYVGSPAAIPFAVSILLGDGITPASGASVTVTASGATFDVCGLSTCTMTASALGTISTLVTATAAGAVTLTASAGGGTVSITFTAISSPDTLSVLSAPSDHSLLNQVAATPFAVKATLGLVANSRLHTLAAIIGGSPDAGQIVTLTAVGARLNACGLPICVLTTDATGTVSTTVTPILAGPVTLLAVGGGGTVSTVFAADTPPGTLHLTSLPANGSYANRVAAAPFAVQVLLADGVTPAASASVTLTATGATLGACGLAVCVVTADATGTASTTVTPSAVGSIQLTAAAAGGTATASFTSAAVPPDALHVTAQPANGSYVARPAATPFTVQTLLGDTSGPAAGASVTLAAVNATLGVCGLSTCVLTADSTGTVSTVITPAALGTVQLTASAGGGSTSASFTAAAVPPDTLQITSHPANGSYASRVATSPLTVQVLFGDTGGPAVGVSVTLSAAGATLGACGASTCAITTDSTGTVSTTVTPAAAGSVSLTAAAGGGTASTTFTAAAVPPDSLHVVAQSANGSYAGRVASAPFTVQVLLGDTGGPAAGVSVTLSSTNATFSACGSTTCVLTADATGTVSTALTPTSTGLVTLTAAAGGGTVSTTFTSAAVPPDVLHPLSQPANGAYAARVAAAPYTVQVLLGDTGNAAAGAAVTLTATGATFGACGLSTCILAADTTGAVSTTVTPSAVGTVQLTASAGGGIVSTSFTSIAVPPDSLQVVSHPPDGSYAGSTATIRFVVQTLLGDTGAPAAGANVTVTASNATLGACNASTCILAADSTGTISTAVTPLAVGPVILTATAGGGAASSSFTAAASPVDTLRIVSQPTGAVYATLPAATAFAVQVMLPDGRTPAPGAAVTVLATRATLGACGGAASCVLTADASGTVSTTVLPQQAGAVSLQASAGGGAVSTTFTALTLPADILTIVSAPSGAVYVGVVASSRFAVHVLLGDGITPASGASVSLTASAATFGSCANACTLTADASGNISTTVTPTTSGTVTLTASSGGGAGSTTFTVTPDVLRVVTSPANNSYTGSPASAPFAVQVLLGDGATPVPGAAVTITSTGATLGACALATCTLPSDAQGTISTTVTATAPGAITLTASANGSTVSASFTAVAPPDILQVLSSPANGSYAGRSSTLPFTVQVSLGTAANRVVSASIAPNTALPVVSGISVTLSASDATLDACGLASCTLITGAQGTVSSTVTPTAAGPVTLSATAAGGAISSSFTAANPPDVLRIASVPANGTYFGRVASAPFTVQVLQGDGLTPASAASVTLTASGATLGACGQPTCILSSDATGMVSTTVTPSAAGTVTLTATAAGGAISASFTAATPPDMVNISSTPADGAYTGRAASQPFTLTVLLGDGVTPAAGASVTLTASNAIFGVCGLPTCTSRTDATGTVSTTVIPALAGAVTLSASAAGGTASASFTAVDPVRTISISRSMEFVATASTVAWTPTVTLLENGLPISGIPVTWSSQPGLSLASPTSTTGADGTATVGLTIGPLVSGSTPTGTACAWTTVCASFGAQAVDPSAWRLIPVSGDTQTVSPADTLQPLILRAVDGTGDWIAGVTIQVNQLVRGWVACPPTGRCPVGPVLAAASSTVVSDLDGLAAITPVPMLNTAETTGIVAAAGPDGYLAVSLSKVP